MTRAQRSSSLSNVEGTTTAPNPIPRQPPYRANVGAYTTRPRRSTKPANTTLAARQTRTATTDASGPKSPPERMAGPWSSPRSTPPDIAWPETAVPKIDPSAKFQPRCNPIGSHNRFVAA